MASLVYRPDHPQRNENGMVPSEIASPKGTDPRFYVISDTIPLTRHMADGKYYDSKRKFREATRAAGCIEYGNDPAVTRPRKRIPLDRNKRRDDIRKTIYNLRNGIKDQNNG